MVLINVLKNIHTMIQKLHFRDVDVFVEFVSLHAFIVPSVKKVSTRVNEH